MRTPSDGLPPGASGSLPGPALVGSLIVVLRAAAGVRGGSIVAVAPALALEAVLPQPEHDRRQAERQQREQERGADEDVLAQRQRQPAAALWRLQLDAQ